MSDALLASYDALLFDLDGTVYHGSRGIPGVPEVLQAVREHGTAVRFVTNNASKAPEAVAEHLSGLGIPARADEVHTSAQAGVAVLAERLPAGAEIVVVGSPSLVDEVRGAGLTPVRENSENVAGVVQGHSPDTSWANLAEACLAIRAGALWVACNVDTTLPSERGLLPGNGSMVAALRTATGIDPVVAGKPERLLFDTAARSVGAEKPLGIGDRLDTDIAGAVAAGIDSLLVLTGVSTAAQLLGASPSERPTYLAESLDALTARPDELRIGPRPGWTVTPDADTLVATGSGEPFDLLRALCDAAWSVGKSAVRAGDEAAADALTRLGLA